jgi:hypothetical protein
VRDVEYKGAPLDAAKGPGLGCFWLQLALLVVLVVLTPLSVAWDWPEAVSAALLLATLVLLLFAGQTVIFLLRLVAADRRAELRRAPMASRSKTVGQLEDETAGGEDEGAAGHGGAASGGAAGGEEEGAAGHGGAAGGEEEGAAGHGGAADGEDEGAAGHGGAADGEDESAAARPDGDT